jgi:RNA recognition motif-containing protein
VRAVYVSGLPATAQADEIRALFAPHGEVRFWGRCAVCCWPVTVGPGQHAPCRAPPARASAPAGRPLTSTGPAVSLPFPMQIEEVTMLQSRDDPNRIREYCFVHYK